MANWVGGEVEPLWLPALVGREMARCAWRVLYPASGFGTVWYRVGQGLVEGRAAISAVALLEMARWAGCRHGATEWRACFKRFKARDSQQSSWVGA